MAALYEAPHPFATVKPGSPERRWEVPRSEGKNRLNPAPKRRCQMQRA